MALDIISDQNGATFAHSNCEENGEQQNSGRETCQTYDSRRKE